ncbi:MAG: malate synthase A, partial [Longimicrobiales bacterium]
SLNRPWMRNYAERLIATCHRRGAFAMGGMAAFTPGRSEALRAEQTRKVLEDKQLEASMGHDGCWVSHPYFIGPALSAFTRNNQLDVVPAIEEQADLLPKGGGPCTLGGLRTNVRVGIAYMRGWRRDIGCVAWDNLMEDLATLEISRAQTWQWLHHEVELEEGSFVALPLVEQVFGEEHQKIADELRLEMADADPALVELALEELADARAEAQSLFTEKRFRSFLTCRSELVVKETK